MANEELIYRITRAIYDRLGAATDESTVEQLVTDIYRTVEPSIGKNGSAPQTSVPARASFGDSGDTELELPNGQIMMLRTSLRPRISSPSWR